MAKFYGAVGYIETTEDAPDVFVEHATERMYKGDLVRNNRRLEKGIGLNDDVTISNTISILADPYANNHIHAIRYVKWRGVAWKISSIDVEPPRIVMTLGGVYNGQTAQPTQ